MFYPDLAHDETIRPNPENQTTLQQANYEASLAERRYAACDPDNRLIAAQLEKNWEAALQRVQASEARLASLETPSSTTPIPNFVGLADDLEVAWNAPGVREQESTRWLGQVPY